MSFLVRFSVVFVIAIGLMDAIWIWFSDFTYDFTGVAGFLFGVATILAISSAINTYTTIPWAKKFTALFIWICIASPYTMVGAPSSYLFASIGGSFKDAYFAAADQALGFDWVAMLTFLSSHPWIGEYSTYIYLSSGKALAVVALFLAFTNRFERGDLLLASVIVSGFIISTLSAFFAATGPFEYYNISPDLYRELAPAVAGAGYEWHTHLMQLRAGEFLGLGQGVYEGIVQFPSFHTALSVLMIVALRGCGPFFWIAGFYNILILLTVPIDGGHYLVDLIAGGLIALIVWYGLAALNQMVQEGVKFKTPALPEGIAVGIFARVAPLVSSLTSMKPR